MTIFEHLKSTPATLAILAAIIGVFGVQIMQGVNIDAPSQQDLLRFGASFLPNDITQPWRLVTHAFLHIGIMHLFFNVFTLFSFGQFCEHSFGKWRFLALFWLSVIAGAIASDVYALWQFYKIRALFVSAGASGGIMGIGMALLTLSFSQHPMAKQLNTKSLCAVMGINLLIGFVIPVINNAAHLGGAFCGAICAMAFLYRPKILSPNTKDMLIIALVGATCLIGWLLLLHYIGAS